MRNALMTLWVIGLFIAAFASTARAGEGEAASIGAAPSDARGVVDISPMLPIDGNDLPLSPRDGYSSSLGQQTSVVEAIPTPTAFQAGVVLMLVLAVGRTVKKFRLV